MRILHVDTGRAMRGGQYQVKLLLNGLRADGHECILLARRDGPLAKAAAGSGFAVYPAGIHELWQHSREVDVVHAHDARAHTMAALAAQKRFVVSRRVGFPVQQTFLSKMKYGRAARYLAISHFVSSELVKAGVPAERVDVVFDAVEQSEKTTAWNSHSPVVAPAFHNDPKKLTQLTGEACRIAGAELILSDNLSLDLQRASAFVYLTRSEGLGSAALLAMAAGVPVIASKVQGLCEVFEDNQSGLYVENSALEVAGCIRRLLDEPELAHRLRHAAFARVLQYFSPARLVSGSVACYKRAVAG